MKKTNNIFDFTAIIIVCICLLSCKQQGGDKVEYFPVKLDKEERWSMISVDGEILYKDEFENAPTVVVNGFFTIREGDTYSVYEALKEPKLIAEGLQEVGIMCNEGLMPITQSNSRISVINKKGDEEFVLLPFEGKEIIRCDIKYSSGLLVVQTEDGKFGYIDTEGNMVISPNYTNAFPFINDYTIVNKAGEKDILEWYVIDKEGNIKLKIDDKYKPRMIGDVYIKDDLVLVTCSGGDKLGFLNLRGDFISLPSKVCDVKDFNNEVFVFENKEGKCGVMSLDDNMTQLIRPKYDNITIISTNEYFVSYNDKNYVVNKEDERIIDFQDYTFVRYMNSPFTGIILPKNYFVGDGDVGYFVDKKGKKTSKTEFYDIAFYGFTEISSIYCEINSEYFDVEGIKGVIQDEIIENYILGEPMSKYVKEYGVYDSTSTEYRVSSFEENRLGCNLSLWLTSDNSFIKCKKDGTKEINPNAKLEKVNISIYPYIIEGKYSLYNNLEEQIVKLFESKGFKIEGEQLVKDQVCVNIGQNEAGAHTLEIEISLRYNNQIIEPLLGYIVSANGNIYFIEEFPNAAFFDLNPESGKGSFGSSYYGKSIYGIAVSHYDKASGKLIMNVLEEGEHIGRMDGYLTEVSTEAQKYNGTYFDGNTQARFNFDLRLESND